MPQDIPPLMRALSCFKICWETADNFRPYDYLDRRQTPFIYEMHEVMGKPFDLTLCVAQSMMVDEKDIEIFFDFYPTWKEKRNIQYHVLDYPMLGITKPVTLTGSIAMYVAELFSIHAVFQAFDPELEIGAGTGSGFITDLRHACWAWGHPRQHLLKYLNSRIAPHFAKVKRDWYGSGGTHPETASSAIDVQCGMEKMATVLMAAMQGARTFTQLGSMCVDDIFSGAQFVIDVELVNYVRDLIESFNPHPDIISIDDDTYANLKAVCAGEDDFISSYDTASKLRNIMPSSNLMVREKLRGWLEHRKTMKDRAREEATERIKDFQPTFHLPEDKQKALDDIYARAEKALVG
jgi:trimethylamine:corrinoid methyltransferase-like protein